ncbi:acyl-CoA dehydrogenase [Micromonospora sp. ANENR4]|uniref:acyl-CoA dehydrogenase family protein n=1 Tax=unclassified Micromonospora TaxID=2617518 RepID=UPI00188EA87C|nr:MULTISPECIES: acyl-CoA dehydrogenase family protein [unclassified Micromonospora]MBF5033938.1 acyl-CoA dehydrogenase [Micromonospora sp. ANENR4]MCZ7478160.1 acyl-CoA/acyl-ACP dehydrogenase [Micromonospora sp. WMMC273]
MTTMRDLESRFGDPWDPANPLGNRAVLAADERQEMFADGELALDDFGLNAEFVPVARGGRMTGLDRLIRTMRSVFRRDPCLGLGYGASSFIASVNVWAGGDEAQQRRLAELLLSGRRVASVYHELAHGNDFARVDFRADPGRPGELLLTGRKEVVTNAQRCSAMVIFSRTSDAAGGRSHTQLFVEKDALPPGALRYLPRFPSSGMRGVQLGGIELDRCPVDAGVALGPLGSAMEVALRSFQLTRTGLPAMTLGVLDTGLRAVLRFGEDRWLRGRPVGAMPVVRTALAEAFTDLLIADCLSTTVARAVHLLPEDTNAYASAVKYVVSGRSIRAMTRLGELLGAQSYLRTGEYGIFQKLQRDLAPAGFGHAARVACLATVLPQLPRLARRSWATGQEPPPTLYDLDADLPALPFDRLRIASAADPITAQLLAAAETMPAGDDRLRGLVRRFTAELARLRSAALGLRPADLAIGGDPAALDLTARYTTVLTAATCLNLWLAEQRHPGTFLADPAWVTAALLRLADELDGTSRSLPAALAGPIHAELARRYAAGRAFDLSDSVLPDLPRSRN